MVRQHSNPRACRRGISSRHRGHTLLELLITAILAAILVGLGIPALSEWRRETQVESTAQLLMTHLQAARTHAVTASREVMICPDSGACGSDDWSRGWTVFEDLDENRRLDRGEPVLLEHRLPQAVTLSWRRRPSWLFYRHSGIGWPNGTFRVCTRSDGRAGAAVVVSGSGRPRLALPSELRPCSL